MSSIATPIKAKIVTLTSPDGSEQILPRTVVTAVSGINEYAKIVDVETPAGAQAKADMAREAAKAASRPSTWMPTAQDVGALPASGGALDVLRINGRVAVMEIKGNEDRQGFDFGGEKILNICAPVESDDAATKGYVDGKVLVFSGKAVAANAWLADTTHSAHGYGFRVSVACAGVTPDHRPDVAFSCVDATGGNFAPVSDSYEGGVYIYAKVKPTVVVTIPSIVCIKGGQQ